MEQGKTTIMENSTPSYYKQINGVKYDKSLLSTALFQMASDRNLSLNLESINLLWEKAQDGGRVTECEKNTLDYIITHLECTADAKMAMKSYLSKIIQEKLDKFEEKVEEKLDKFEEKVEEKLEKLE